MICAAATTKYQPSAEDKARPLAECAGRSLLGLASPLCRLSNCRLFVLCLEYTRDGTCPFTIVFRVNIKSPVICEHCLIQEAYPEWTPLSHNRIGPPTFVPSQFPVQTVYISCIDPMSLDTSWFIPDVHIVVRPFHCFKGSHFRG